MKRCFQPKKRAWEDVKLALALGLRTRVTAPSKFWPVDGSIDSLDLHRPLLLQLLLTCLLDEQFPLVPLTATSYHPFNLLLTTRITSTMSANPQPPRLDTGIVQEGTFQARTTCRTTLTVLIESSDDHFSSASEGDESKSPIPITRVERVDDDAAYGEVPNTPAYNLRAQDAVPDEVEVVPEGRRSRSSTTSRSRAASNLSTSSRPQTPGGSPVPKTVVEKVDDNPSYGEVDGTSAKETRMADATPDEVRKAPEEARKIEGR